MIETAVDELQAYVWLEECPQDLRPKMSSVS